MESLPTTTAPPTGRAELLPDDVVAIPVLEPRETSGMTSKLVLSYVERQGGEAAIQEVLARCGLEDREQSLRDESSWFSFDAKIQLFEAAAEVLGDPQVMWRVGESALELSVADGLKAALRALGTPGLVYRNVVRANAKFNTVQGMELVEVGRDHARVRFTDLAGVGFHPLDCDYTAGLLSCVPALFGQPLARISHPVCGVTGGDACVYDVSWSRYFSPMRTLLGAGAASVLAVGAAALLAPALVPAGLGVAAAAGGVCAWRMHRATRLRWEQLERESREHLELGERLAASLQDLAGELRLEELLEKITHNAQSAVGGKEYALLVEDDGEHRCLSSSGLPAATLTALEGWLGRPGGRLAEPVLVDDVGLVKELAPIGLQETMPLRSICASPLFYRGRTLGALVALAPQRSSFLPRDVDLLRSYAVQAAITLVNARLFEMQERLAARDPLTGLLNRRELHDHLGREIDRCDRHGGGFSLVLLDLDGFKLVNDTGGHSAGDEVLRRVAQALERSTRGSDVAFRMGGDEVALLLTGQDESVGIGAAERACEAIADADGRVTASYGLARWPQDGHDDDAVLAAADLRLYAMKGTRGRRTGSRTTPDELNPACCLSRSERLTVISSLSRRLGVVEDAHEVIRVATQELESGFGCYEPSIAAGMGQDSNATASLPIRVGDRIWGSLSLASPGHDLHDEDRMLLEAAVAQIGLALQLSDLLERVERTFTDTVGVLSDALEAKDAYTAAHTREVADLAERVADRLGMPDAELRNVVHAALLHDIGKIAIRNEVLNKPGPLTDAEFGEIQQHTLAGVNMLERIEKLSSVLPLIRSAHERWDGTGYPDRIAGEAIPLGARVICACDAFHAMVSDRPYRSALAVTEAVEEVRRCAGSQFDPAVVAALLAELAVAPKA
jgi:diguanylate cyclase (GGDEF)-like protein/putative nucleotidyltransferase with HDIG domain